MPLAAHIVVFGETQFARELRFMGRRATAARPLYDTLGFKLVKIQREQFASQGARSSGGWKPLADSTIRRKGHDTILVDSSALRDSFMYGDANNIFEVTDDFLKYGSDIAYGPPHQFGGTRDGVPDRPPQRRVFELREDDRVDIVKDMQHWVIRGELRDF